MTHSDHPRLAPERTRFVGRARELDELGRRFAEGARVLSVIGASGTGKTRLAREYVIGALGGRAWFVDLSDARSLGDILAAVGRALDLPLGSDLAALPKQIERALRARGDDLVVLDNFEQVQSHAEATIGAWLSAGCATRFLVTSRVPLGLAGEVRFELEPLSLPDAGDDRVETVATSDAVRLFVDRAQSLDAAFELDVAQARGVAELVRRLDGIPLAIELCAARASLLSPEQLLQLLGSRFEVLVAPDGAARPARQATLRGAIDWSWELLEIWQRDALAQCSVFRAAFDLEAARAVIDVSAHAGAPGGGLWPIDVLQALHDRSLLPSVQAGPHEKRWRLLESVRDYAAEKLRESGGETAALARHARHYLSMASAWREAALSRSDVAALDRLTLESPNLLAIWQRSLSAADHESAARAALSLQPVYMFRGPLGRYLELLDPIVAALEAEPSPPPLFVEILSARGWANAHAGKTAKAIGDYQAAIRHASSSANRRETALCQARLGLCHAWQRDDEKAERAFAAARDAVESVDDRRVHGVVQSELGIFRGRQGKMDDALGHFRIALREFEAAGARREQATALVNLGLRHVERAELDQAKKCYERALEIVRELREHRLTPSILAQLGWIAIEESAASEARARCEAALEVARQVGVRHWEGMALGYLGHVAQIEGDASAARQSIAAACEILAEIGDRRSEGLFLAAQAASAALAGDGARADEQLRAAGERLAHSGRGHDALVLDASRAVLALASARGAEIADARRAARAVRERGAGLVSDEARVALALLDRTLASLSPAASGPRLEVDARGYWFRLGSGERCDLSRRPNLRLILEALLASHQKSPEQSLDVARLFALGWPGERARVDAAAHRVHVAVGSLRKLGLGELLITRDGGYLLDPALEVVLSAGERR